MTVLLLSSLDFLISVYLLISVDRTSNTVFNKHGESGHSYLIANFRKNVFSFSLLGMILAVDLSYMAFIMLKCVISMPIFNIIDVEVYEKVFLHLFR